ncbi:hypothetical protein Trydic_g8533 [Trypoxylus dichotomus]
MSFFEQEKNYKNLVKDLIARIESGDGSTQKTPKVDYRRAYSTPTQRVTIEADMVRARVQQFTKVETKTTETAENKPQAARRPSLPAGNESFISMKNHFEVKESETIEINASNDEESIESNSGEVGDGSELR